MGGAGVEEDGDGLGWAADCDCKVLVLVMDGGWAGGYMLSTV